MDYELIKPDAQDKYDPAPFLNYARSRRTDKEDRDASVADLVHLWNGRCYAALVVDESGRYDDPRVDLVLFTLDDHLPFSECPHDETRAQSHSWHWPCGGQ